MITTEEEEETLWAMITDTQGEVKVIRNGEEVTTTPLRLRAEDEISTGEDGWAEISFLDGTVIRISPNCCFTFRELVEEITKEETFWGRIWGRISAPWRMWAVTPGRPWQIETSTAVTSVRGTEFTLEVAQDGTTILTVFEGKVEFSDLALTQTVLVGPCQTSVIVPGGMPSSPASVDPVEIDRWWEWGEETPIEVPVRIPLAVAIIVIVVVVVQPRKSPA